MHATPCIFWTVAIDPLKILGQILSSFTPVWLHWGYCGFNDIRLWLSALWQKRTCQGRAPKGILQTSMSLKTAWPTVTRWELHEAIISSILLHWLLPDSSTTGPCHSPPMTEVSLATHSQWTLCHSHLFYLLMLLLSMPPQNFGRNVFTTQAPLHPKTLIVIEQKVCIY